MRSVLDETAPRRLAVLRPLKIIITNVADDHVEMLPADNFPGRGAGTYDIPFSKVVYIEEGDFKEADEKGFFGLAPGKEVRFKLLWFGIQSSNNSDYREIYYYIL